MNKLRVCIIGAGLSGLCAAKHLKQKGFSNITVYESTSRLGGVWNFHPDPSHPGALYKNLTTNLPHQLMQFPDFPFPNAPSIDTYPHHSVVLDYLRAYHDHFDLAPYIRYHHKVIKLIPPSLASPSAPPQSLPQWTVYVEDTQSKVTHQETFDSVIVCNGHYTKPHIPDFIGLRRFQKPIVHSQSYREPSRELFEHKCVVVVGYRSSGIDIALDIFSACDDVTLFQV